MKDGNWKEQGGCTTLAVVTRRFKDQSAQNKNSNKGETEEWHRARHKSSENDYHRGRLLCELRTRVAGFRRVPVGGNEMFSKKSRQTASYNSWWNILSVEISRWAAAKCQFCAVLRSHKADIFSTNAIRRAHGQRNSFGQSKFMKISFLEGAHYRCWWNEGAGRLDFFVNASRQRIFPLLLLVICAHWTCFSWQHRRSIMEPFGSFDWPFKFAACNRRAS